jgi:hypothetical protein
MPRGLFRDEYGWVEVDHGGVQSPMLREKYIAGCYQPPYDTLPIIGRPSRERLNDPEYWRRRAEEARAIAEQMIDPDTFAIMVRVAEQYDNLAERAERCGLAIAGLGRKHGARPT